MRELIAVLLLSATATLSPLTAQTREDSIAVSRIVIRTALDSSGEWGKKAGAAVTRIPASVNDGPNPQSPWKVLSDAIVRYAPSQLLKPDPGFLPTCPRASDEPGDPKVGYYFSTSEPVWEGAGHVQVEVNLECNWPGGRYFFASNLATLQKEGAQWKVIGWKQSGIS